MFHDSGQKLLGSGRAVCLSFFSLNRMIIIIFVKTVSVRVGFLLTFFLLSNEWNGFFFSSNKQRRNKYKKIFHRWKDVTKKINNNIEHQNKTWGINSQLKTSFLISFSHLVYFVFHSFMVWPCVCVCVLLQFERIAFDHFGLAVIFFVSKRMKRFRVSRLRTKNSYFERILSGSRSHIRNTRITSIHRRSKCIIFFFVLNSFERFSAYELSEHI